MLSSLLSHLARLCLSTGLINRRGRHRDWQQQIRPCAITATALLLQDATATTSLLLGDILVPTDLCKEPARTLCVGQAPLTLSGYQGKIIMGFAIHPAPAHHIWQGLIWALFNLGLPRHKLSHASAASLCWNSGCQQSCSPDVRN